MNPYRREAIDLRIAGYSYGMIKEKIGVSKSTLSNWLTDIKFVPNQEVIERIGTARLKSALHKQNVKFADIEKMKNQGMTEVGTLTPRDLFMLGIGLYLGEGSKATEEIRVVNADPKILKLCIKWLRESMGFSIKNFQITVHGYPDTDPGEAIGFWSEELQFPLSQFGKVVIDRRTDKSPLKHGKLPYGTVGLSVRKRDADFCLKSSHRRIAGWINAVMQQI
ncbi:MAG: hypothetical protein Q8Q94_03665 [bacterium]|nr:hypothetical protein [bacterium]